MSNQWLLSAFDMPSVQNVSPDLALSKIDEESKKIQLVIKALGLL